MLNKPPRASGIIFDDTRPCQGPCRSVRVSFPVLPQRPHRRVPWRAGCGRDRVGVLFGLAFIRRITSPITLDLPRGILSRLQVPPESRRATRRRPFQERSGCPGPYFRIVIFFVSVNEPAMSL